MFTQFLQGYSGVRGREDLVIVLEETLIDLKDQNFVVQN